MNHPSRSCLLAFALLSFGAISAFADSAAPAANRAPEIISAPQPVRPQPVFNFVTSGTVEVAFTITADGSVDQVKIHRSTDALLEAPVLAAIKQWTFNPAVKNGRTVAVRRGSRSPLKRLMRTPDRRAICRRPSRPKKPWLRPPSDCERGLPSLSAQPVSAPPADPAAALALPIAARS